MCLLHWRHIPLLLSAMTGSYYFNFTGFGSVVAQGDAGERGVRVTNVTTDATSTAGWIVIDPGAPDLLVLNVTATRRTAGAAPGTGVTDFRIMAPGSGPQTPAAAWAPRLLELLQPFDHVRLMGIAGTNAAAGYYGDAGHHALEWATNRCLPSDAQWPNTLREGCWGAPWELAVRLAQATRKGLWVNLPVSATLYNPVNTSSYAYQWATLLRDGNADTGGAGAPPGLPIYVEHSNEVRAYRGTPVTRGPHVCAFLTPVTSRGDTHPEALPRHFPEGLEVSATGVSPVVGRRGQRHRAAARRDVASLASPLLPVTRPHAATQPSRLLLSTMQ